MAELTFAERQSIEKAFRMSSGYVLDFTNRMFDEFVFDAIKVDAAHPRYSSQGQSKANRLRGIMSAEPAQVVARLLLALAEYGLADPSAKADHARITAIASRLRDTSQVSDIEAISARDRDETFASLAEAVRESIDKGKPEQGLDRLHTYMVKYLRARAQALGVPSSKDDPLHSLMGRYVKALTSKGSVTSEMTQRILKSSISILEAFNDVRNNRSLAHDNQVLARLEAQLIVEHVATLVRFLDVVDSRQ